MEHGTPGVEVNATNRVAKEEAPERGLSPRCHDLQVWFPTEFVVDKDSKVAD